MIFDYLFSRNDQLIIDLFQKVYTRQLSQFSFMIKYPQIQINNFNKLIENEEFHSLFPDVRLQNDVKFFFQLVQL